MKIIIGEVGSGKTKTILKESQDKGAPILTDSARRKEKLLDKAERYGLTVPVPMVVGEDCIPTDGTYIIDNIKTVLEKIFGSKVICDFHRFFIKPRHIVYVNRYLDDGDKYILVIQNSNAFTKKIKEYEFKVNKEDVLEFEEI